MKKVFLFFFAIAAVSELVTGQITLNQNDYLRFDSRYYRTFLYNNLEMQPIAQEGPNQTWDFSNLGIEVRDTLEVIKADLTPYFDQFQEADLAITSSQNAFFYERITLEGSIIVGRVNVNPVLNTFVVTKFDFNGYAIPFPLDYEDSYSFSYRTDVKSIPIIPIADTIRAISNIISQIDVVGYGNVILPSGTFEVLMLKQTATVSDSIYYHSSSGWNFNNHATFEVVTQLFYPKAIGYRVLTCEFLAGSNQTYRYIGWVTGYDVNPISLEKITTPEMGVYPVPAAEWINFSLPEPALITWLNQMGQIVYQEHATESLHMSNISNLKSGVYHVRADLKSGLSVNRKVVVTH